MEYPLNMRFRLWSLSTQINVTDANGQPVCFVQQKMFRLKEAVTVFSNPSKTQLLCEIKADRVIDWSASYHFIDAQGESFGAVRRKGMRSLFKAHYEVLDEDNAHISTITEENPMAKIFDSLFSEVPVLGLFSGYLFHPRYVLTSVDGQPRMRVTKQRAFLEGRYILEKLVDYDPVAELRALMAFLMMTLLERRRG